ncbi:hypothetical protein OESDEN_24327 [Oesophagostomum dentatum]|uniref:Uncharacterized protein n=1 Tax=Oesophagostomum dentatum TaxID=61180 RepID=A0A0B1RTR2_OESDE|nr:hypothetical protein OESDEN_24327 [Oesophagostomum dentatum]
MALNLISSYDSDTDSNCSDSQSTSQEATEGLEAEDAQSSEKKSSFFFGGDDADSNDEEEDSHSKRQHAPEDKNRSGTSRRLPSAMSVLKGHHTVRISSLCRFIGTLYMLLLRTSNTQSYSLISLV